MNKWCPLTVLAFLECISLHLDGPYDFNIKTFTFYIKLNQSYTFHIEEFRSCSISKLIIRSRRWKFDLQHRRSIFGIEGLKNDLISCRCLQYRKSSISGTIYQWQTLRYPCCKTWISGAFYIGHNMQYCDLWYRSHYWITPNRDWSNALLYWSSLIKEPDIEGLNVYIEDYLILKVLSNCSIEAGNVDIEGTVFDIEQNFDIEDFDNK